MGAIPPSRQPERVIGAKLGVFGFNRLIPFPQTCGSYSPAEETELLFMRWPVCRAPRCRFARVQHLCLPLEVTRKQQRSQLPRLPPFSSIVSARSISRCTLASRAERWRDLPVRSKTSQSKALHFRTPTRTCFAQMVLARSPQAGGRTPRGNHLARCPLPCSSARRTSGAPEP